MMKSVLPMIGGRMFLTKTEEEDNNKVSILFSTSNISINMARCPCYAMLLLVFARRVTSEFKCDTVAACRAATAAPSLR